MALTKEKLEYYHKKIEETFDIVYCKINIHVEKNYEKAEYEFEYKIKKRDKANYTDNDFWFLVIAYPESHVKLLEKEDKFKTDYHSLPDGRTILLIDMKRQYNIEEEITLSYSFKTKIESIVENSLLRKSGNITYYIAHVSPCYHLYISVNFKKRNTRFKRFHPLPNKISKEIIFEKQNLSPLDFYILNILYETGLPKTVAKIIDKLIWVLIGIGLTLFIKYYILPLFNINI